MYSSSSVSRIILIYVSAIQLLLINSKLSLNVTNEYLNHTCLVSQGKYKLGSEYDKLFKNIMKMFYKNSIRGYDLFGDSTFTAILQCRGDSYGPKCRDCFVTALAALRRRCPWYKGRIIWYDQCLLSMDSKYSVGQIDYDNNFCMSNAKKVVEDRSEYIKVWNILVDDLTELAITGDNSTLYSVGEKRYKGGDMVYGMVQCAKDLSRKACQECLWYNSFHFQDCVNYFRGARVVGRSCTFRFEFYPFIAKQVHNI
ncbi:BnaCnng07210D [Brassica napus]|uniref:BnaCnng07210D protein n=1 Tax=Brassica napus TaxID=3708 RepID=A0A078H3E6_BRANA|nr:BnaCnng07210D [Brassica napus]